MSQVVFVQEKKIVLVLHLIGQDFTLRPNSNTLIDFWQNFHLHLIFLLYKMMLNMAILILKYDVNDNKN